MKSLIDNISRLNQSSKDILLELKNDEPSLEFVQKKMEGRDHLVAELNQFVNNFQNNSISPDERIHLNALFDEFIQLNNFIQRTLKESLNQTEKRLGAATQKRKAEDGYHILEKPDISYF